MHVCHLFWRTFLSRSLSLCRLISTVPLLSPSCPVSPLSPSSSAAFSLTLCCQHLFSFSCQLSILSFLPPFPLSFCHYSLSFISSCSAVSFSTLSFSTLSFLSIIFLLYVLSISCALSLYCHFLHGRVVCIFGLSRPCRVLYLYFLFSFTLSTLQCISLLFCLFL